MHVINFTSFPQQKANFSSIRARGLPLEFLLVYYLLSFFLDITKTPLRRSYVDIT